MAATVASMSPLRSVAAPNLPNVAKKWSWPVSAPGTKPSIDHACNSRVLKAPSVAASAAGRWPSGHLGVTGSSPPGTAVAGLDLAVIVAVSMHRPSSIASWMSFSVGTAPDRWLWRSAPFGNDARNERSFAGLARIVSR